MKKLLVAMIVSSFALVGCNSSTTPKTEDEKAFYALGHMMGARFSTLNMSNDEVNALAQGIKDAAKKVDPVVKIEEYQPKLQGIFQKRIEANAQAVKEEGKVAIDKFVKEEGAKQTPSGLAYKMLKEGSGKVPSANDMVEVHYHGTLLDGTVFDSSVERGKTVTFPLNRVIKGWTEGLQLVKEGGKIRLMIPSDLAYGNNGAPPKIPGGATLVFDVDLISIKAAPNAKAPKVKKAKK